MHSRTSSTSGSAAATTVACSGTAPNIVRRMRTSSACPATGVNAAGLLSAIAIGKGRIAPTTTAPPRRRRYTGSNDEMSQAPSIFCQADLDAARGEGAVRVLLARGGLVDEHQHHRAYPAAISDTAARTTEAVGLDRFLLGRRCDDLLGELRVVRQEVAGQLGLGGREVLVEAVRRVRQQCDGAVGRGVERDLGRRGVGLLIRPVLAEVQPGRQTRRRRPAPAASRIDADHARSTLPTPPTDCRRRLASAPGRRVSAFRARRRSAVAASSTAVSADVDVGRRCHRVTVRTRLSTS